MLATSPADFKKRYGTMFSEFKNDKGTPSTMFYGWFFMRRALYTANIIFMRSFILG